MAAVLPIATGRNGICAPRPAPVHEIGRLADGTDVVLRPILAEDDALERAFISGLSRDSRYNRLLGSRKLTAEEIRQLTRIDYEREMAFVAVAGSGQQARLLGVARYVRDADAGGAEFALVVADAWQRKGVGTLLLQALQRQARAAGIERLHGITFSSNQAMQNLARKLGFVQRANPQDATLRQVEKTLLPVVCVATGAAGAAYCAAANDAGLAPCHSSCRAASAGASLHQAAAPSAGASPG